MEEKAAGLKEKQYSWFLRYLRSQLGVYDHCIEQAMFGGKFKLTKADLPIMVMVDRYLNDTETMESASCIREYLRRLETGDMGPIEDGTVHKVRRKIE